MQSRKFQPDERIALYVIVRKQGLILLQDYTTDREQILKRLRDHSPLPNAAFTHRI